MSISLPLNTSSIKTKCIWNFSHIFLKLARHARNYKVKRRHRERRNGRSVVTTRHARKRSNEWSEVADDTGCYSDAPSHNRPENTGRCGLQFQLQLRCIQIPTDAGIETGKCQQGFFLILARASAHELWLRCLDLIRKESWKRKHVVVVRFCWGEVVAFWNVKKGRKSAQFAIWRRRAALLSVANAP